MSRTQQCFPGSDVEFWGGTHALARRGCQACVAVMVLIAGAEKVMAQEQPATARFPPLAETTTPSQGSVNPSAPPPSPPHASTPAPPPQGAPPTPPVGSTYPAYGAPPQGTTTPPAYESYPPPAGAAPPAGAPPPAYGYAPYGYWQPPEPRRRWYGWQTLTLDAIALGLLIVAAESNNDSANSSLALAGLVGYLVGPPVAHALHGHAGKALGSAGMRVGSIALLGLAVTGCYGDSNNECAPLAVLAVLSIPAAIAVDAAVVAREDVPPDELVVWVGPWKSVTGQPGIGGRARLAF